MPRVLKDNVNIEGRWYTRGQTAEQVGDAAGQIGSHNWEGEDDVDASTGPEQSNEQVQRSTPEVPVAGSESGERSDSASGSELTEVSAQPAGSGAEAEGAVEGSSSEGAGEVPDVAKTAAAGPPPHSGPGSGVAAWREYAGSLGVEVDAEASRGDVIEALRSAGRPVD